MKPRIIHDFAPPGLLRAVAATWPRDDWPHWHRYDDRNAAKLGSKDAHRLPDAARAVLSLMAAIDVSDFADAAFPDLDMHGAGLHSILPGGHLGLHLDGAVHPLTGWRREANAVLFVDDWDADWGGELEFWSSPQSRGPRRIVTPRRNTLVLFATGPTAWHRVARVDGPQPRRTLSLFWWSLAAAKSNRDRAEFAR
ncbi:MAG: 2OG-Fe(II) oxygenase [Elusimicrobia bacterium]|nr:2OG-Fe(II) oxygenase [Elusimicrobiota bacterium]